MSGLDVVAAIVERQFEPMTASPTTDVERGVSLLHVAGVIHARLELEVAPADIPELVTEELRTPWERALARHAQHLSPSSRRRFVAELREGHVLCEDLRADDGTVLAGRGTRLSHAHIARLRLAAQKQVFREPVFVTDLR